jgi:hypothetical protein
MKTDARGVSRNRSRLMIRIVPLTASAIVLWSAVAAAQAPAAADVGGPAGTVAAAAGPAVAPPPAAPPAPPPYSLPFQLRPVAPGTVFRVDTTYASYSDPTTHQDGSTVASMILASYKVTPNLSPLVRIGLVQNNAPQAAPMAAYPTVSGNATSNPLVGLIYGRKVDALRFAGFGAVTIPIGGGGGGPPDPTKPGIAGAESQAVLARSGMDNAMFAVNYFTAIVGADAAYVAHKLTVQAEATVFQLFRARGDNNLKASNDSTRTNSTFGLHVGYFLLPMLSIGSELRYQRWLSTPTTGAKNATTGVITSTNFADNKLDTMTVAIGPRFHFKVGKSIWIRPGLSYARGLDRPLTDASYNIFQFDVPVIF